WTEATRCRILHNSLFTKEFSVSTAPEVGRIIDFQDLPSTLNFAFLSITYDRLKNNQLFYIKTPSI
ncbi:hypothetical protein, partial [Pseudomonas gessardii]|uniref:hypothetical protein n=1 Tax=Pseudomonas gessardii TaxID=78544 RepID=UPI001F2F13D4